MTKPKIIAAYVTLLNGHATRLDDASEITCDRECALQVGDLPAYLSRMDAWVRYRTKAVEYESEEDFKAAMDGDEPWKADAPVTQLAYDTIYARAVGNIVVVYDEEVEDD